MIVFIKVYCHTSRYFCCFFKANFGLVFPDKNHAKHKDSDTFISYYLSIYHLPVFLAFKGMFLLNNLPLLSALSYGYH